MTIYQHMGGRLGNQLFQWAYSHVLYQEYGEVITPFVDLHHHDLVPEGLLDFSVECAHVGKVVRRDLLGVILGALDKIGSGKIQDEFCKLFRIVRARDSYSLPELPVRKPKVVTGFFINSEIVRNMEDLLFGELTSKLTNVPLVEGLPSVYQAVHVRRGDFIHYKETYGLLANSYYLESVSQKLPIVLCTDSIQDSSEIIDRLKPDFVLGPQDSEPWQVLSVFARASHAVMSNSTLSWWGGFMAAMNGSSVIQPKPFYRSISKHSNQFDFKLFSTRTPRFED